VVGVVVGGVVMRPCRHAAGAVSTAATAATAVDVGVGGQWAAGGGWQMMVVVVIAVRVYNNKFSFSIVLVTIRGTKETVTISS